MEQLKSITLRNKLAKILPKLNVFKLASDWNTRRKERNMARKRVIIEVAGLMRNLQFEEAEQKIQDCGFEQVDIMDLSAKRAIRNRVLSGEIETAMKISDRYLLSENEISKTKKEIEKALIEKIKKETEERKVELKKQVIDLMWDLEFDKADEIIKLTKMSKREVRKAAEKAWARNMYFRQAYAIKVASHYNLPKEYATKATEKIVELNNAIRGKVIEDENDFIRKKAKEVAETTHSN